MRFAFVVPNMPRGVVVVFVSSTVCRCGRPAGLQSRPAVNNDNSTIAERSGANAHQLTLRNCVAQSGYFAQYCAVKR